jgi:hypothetical protein
MRNRILLALGLIGILSLNAFGAFVAPTDKQIAQAANTPATIRSLLVDASILQAADVIKSVIIKILSLGLQPAMRDARVAAVVSNAIKSMPDKAEALAAALGKTIAASPTASGTPQVVSAIQQAIILSAGSNGGVAGAAFGNAYNLAMQSIAGAPGGGKIVPPTPPPPPVALPYEGQSLL